MKKSKRIISLAVGLALVGCVSTDTANGKSGHEPTPNSSTPTVVSKSPPVAKVEEITSVAGERASLLSLNTAYSPPESPLRIEDGKVTIVLREGDDIEVLGAHVVALYNDKLLPKLQGNITLNNDDLAFLRVLLKTELCILNIHTSVLVADMLGKTLPPSLGEEGGKHKNGIGEESNDEYDKMLLEAAEQFSQSSDSPTRKLLRQFGSYFTTIDPEIIEADIHRCLEKTGTDNLSEKYYDRYLDLELYTCSCIMGPVGLIYLATTRYDRDKISQTLAPYEAFQEPSSEFSFAWASASEVVQPESDFLIRIFDELRKYEQMSRDGANIQEIRQLRAEFEDAYRISVTSARVVVYDVPCVVVLKNGLCRIIKAKGFLNDQEDKMIATGLNISSNLNSYAIAKVVSPYTAHVYGEFVKLLKDELSKDEFKELKSKASFFEHGFILYRF